jgi:hypothetical protein
LKEVDVSFVVQCDASSLAPNRGDRELKEVCYNAVGEFRYCLKC